MMAAVPRTHRLSISNCTSRLVVQLELGIVGGAVPGVPCASAKINRDALWSVSFAHVLCRKTAVHLSGTCDTPLSFPFKLNRGHASFRLFQSCPARRLAGDSKGLSARLPWTMRVLKGKVLGARPEGARPAPCGYLSRAWARKQYDQQLGRAQGSSGAVDGVKGKAAARAAAVPRRLPRHSGSIQKRCPTAQEKLVASLPSGLRSRTCSL